MNNDFRLNKTEMQIWETKLIECLSYSVNKIRKETQKKHLLVNHKEDLIKLFSDNLDEYCTRNPNEPVFELENGYNRFTYAYERLPSPKIKDIEDSLKEMEESISSITKEYDSMVDILYSHPSKEEMEIVSEWCNNHKRDEIKCGTN